MSLSTYTLLPVFPGFSVYLNDPQGISIEGQITDPSSYAVKIYQKNSSVQLSGKIQTDYYVGDFANLYVPNVNISFALSLTALPYDGAITLQNNLFSIPSVEVEE